MNYSKLSLEQTPPFSVPVRYFLTAPVFGLAAGVILLAYGPDAFASRWASPLLAVTHFLTLGFMAMTMVGAMQQLLPVLAGAPIVRPTAVSGTLHVLLVTGTLGLGLGLLWGQRLLLTGGVVSLLLLVCGFLFVVALSLKRAKSGHDTVRAMKQAVAALGVTGVLGMILVITHIFPSLAVARHLTDLHLTWGLLGWVGLLVMGVGYQVVPMFQMTPEYPKAMTASLTQMLFIGLTVWSIFTFTGRDGAAFARWAAAAVALGLGVGFTWFAVKTLMLQQRRRRRLPDVTLSYWRLGMASALLAVLLWLLGPVWRGELGNRELLIGVLLVQGFAVSVISGMLYKIVPFLVWLHLNNQMQSAGRWQGRIPNMKQIVAERWARLQFWLHGAALLSLLLAAWSAGWAYLAAVGLLASNAALLANLAGAVRLYRRHCESLRVATTV